MAAKRFLYISSGILAIAVATGLGSSAAFSAWVGGLTLPATGQSTCFNNEAAQTCPVPGYPGQDAENAYNPLSYSLDATVPDQPTVIDNVTGLEWTQQILSVYPLGVATWQVALVTCDTSHYGGHDDWRLPNVKELFSIADFGESYPVIDPIFGSGSEGSWTSTTLPYPAENSKAYFVSFVEGTVLSKPKSATAWVRAVRSGTGTTGTEKTSWGGIKRAFK